ncbi:MAG: methyl-accepting chemotaxis protein [Desulfovibrio sp.]|uniref:methyl-accepting chemotaxis protein n=1 Tax=Desulfovibrio sp. 7SRBS1 TaxID=3378064 RepID=UPI003B425DA4
MLRSFHIGTRVYTLVCAVLLFTVAVSFVFVLNIFDLEKISADQIQNRLLEAQQDKLKVAVDSMAKTLAGALKSIDSEEKQIERIKELTRDIRFEKDSSGYFFVYKGTTALSVPAKTSVEGKDISGAKDKNGVFYVQELAKAAQSGGGYIKFIFKKPGAGDQPKLGYSQKIKGTDFWIGTGVYLDNVEAAKTELNETMHALVMSHLTKLISASAVIFALLLLAALAIVRSIIRPIGEATAAARKIASGDLDVALDERGRDEAALLQTALNTMVNTLHTNIEEITAKTHEAEDKAEAAAKATEQAEEATRRAERAKAEGMAQAATHLEEIVARIAEASERISSQSEEIRRGTDIQRDRVQETATAMEEMNATVLEVARNAGSAAEKGQESCDKAQEGKGVVEKSVRAVNTTQKQTMELKDNMNALVNQAEAIGNILNVITDIADQTNLLALNAAIEAARAGDAGRGFAVVADEVRKLAEKTMGATKEVGEAITAIQTVIRSNTDSVDQTVTDLETVSELSTHSGEMLEQIVSDATESADQIQSIATAAEEQSATSEEINRSVEEINRITIETAQGITESVNALFTLSEQVGELEQLIASFKSASFNSQG